LPDGIAGAGKIIQALVHVTRPGTYPHLIRTPGEATDVALAVQHGMRTARLRRKPRDIYVPDLRIETLKVRARDFR
jgi:hypothetical protein